VERLERGEETDLEIPLGKLGGRQDKENYSKRYMLM
jgi:hypothetical protein